MAQISSWCLSDESYHGVVYTERFGLEGAFITKATSQLMRDFGSIQSPQNAFLLNMCLRAFMFAWRGTARTASRLPSSSPAIRKLPGSLLRLRSDDPNYELAQKYLPNGSCGV